MLGTEQHPRHREDERDAAEEHGAARVELLPAFGADRERERQEAGDYGAEDEQQDYEGCRRAEEELARAKVVL